MPLGQGHSQNNQSLASLRGPAYFVDAPALRLYPTNNACTSSVVLHRGMKVSKEV